MDINQAVRNLHTLRLTYASARAQRDVAVTLWETEHFDLLANVRHLAEDVAYGEYELRQAAEDIFIATGDRKPCPGVEVKDFTELVYDGNKAFEWAKFHEMALALDKKAFEAIAKAAQPPLDFVAIFKLPKATIATDLGKALGEGKT